MSAPVVTFDRFELTYVRRLHQRACAAAARLAVISISDAERARLEGLGKGLKELASTLRDSSGAARMAVLTRATSVVSEFERSITSSTRPTCDADPAAAPVLYFSPRQREVLYWIGQAKTPTEIGIILGVSVKTVSTHRKRLLAKLNFENTAQLMRYGIVEGIELNG